MIRLLLTIAFVFIYDLSFSQHSDFISVRRKNGRTIKTFIAGLPILFETKNETMVSGTIKDIRNDSLFVTTYDIRTLPTQFWGARVDTISRYNFKIHYKDILRIEVFDRPRPIRGKIDKILMYGGAGYFAVNIINSAIYHQSVTEKENLVRLGIAAGAFGIGFIIKKFFYINSFNRKRHKIVYVNMH